MSSVNTLAELIKALDDSGVGVNVILFEGDKKEEKDDDEDYKDDDSWWNDVELEGMFGGAGTPGGGSSMDTILQGVNTP